MTGGEHNWHARAIHRAWVMVLRHAERGDQARKEQWLAEWQRLCNEYIANVEFKDKEWPWATN